MAGAPEAEEEGGGRVRAIVFGMAALLIGGCDVTEKPSRPDPVIRHPATPAAPDQNQSPKFGPKLRVDSERAMQYTREMVAFGRRAPGSEGYKKTQDYIRGKLKNDQLQEVAFTANTPVGKFTLTNFVARFPGTKDGIIVLASHYETNYPLKDYVGANDSGSSTGSLLALADQLRGKKNNGPAVWLVFFDGEEAFKKWSDKDSLYGSRYLAAQWKKDGTAAKIKAFILLDMVGDTDLNIERDANSTRWLSDLLLDAAKNVGTDRYFFNRYTAVDDDHVPFAEIGVPVVDVIDLDYGPDNSYHHTPQDTLDKVSPKSLQIVGDTVLELIRLLNARE